MDKTSFEDIIGEVVAELDDSVKSPEEAEETETEEEAPETEDEEVEETSEDEEEEEDSEEDDESEEEEESEDEDVEEDDSIPSGTTKDAEAFARMRTENKQYKDIVNFFDSRAKAMGMQGVNDLMEKTKEAELKKSAESQGIPLEIAKKIQDLEARLDAEEAEKKQAIDNAINTQINNAFNSFVQANKLNEKQVNDLAKDLIADGISLDFFRNVPVNTIDRILKSYLPSDFNKQKELAKKEKIKKETPVSGKSHGSSTSQEDEIDKIAKMILERP